MGLDISVWANVQKVAPDVLDRIMEDPDGPREGIYNELGRDGIWIPEVENFPGRVAGLELGMAYLGEKVFSFRAGSYGGYNMWRNQLAQLAGMKSAQEFWNLELEQQKKFPFWQLVNFSDCEGIIGPEVSAELAKNFAEFDERAKVFDPDTGGWNSFYERYKEWKLVFETASEGGLVEFH
jgi:hypothetical protein